jgi:O-antigen/teichoic acid export membrane protein
VSLNTLIDSLKASAFVNGFFHLLLRPVISNTFATILLRGMTIGVRLSIIFFIARNFDSATLGVVIFAFSVIEIAKVLADSGLDILSVRELAIYSDQAETQQFQGTVAVIKLAGGLISYSILALYYLLFQTNQYLIINLIISLLVPTTLWLNFSANYFQAKLEMAQVLLPSIFCNLVTLTLLGMLFVWRQSLVLGLLLLVVNEVVNGWLLYRRMHEDIHIRLHTTISAVIRLLQRCLPLIVTVVIVTIYTRLDIFFLNGFLTVDVVGLYGLAFRFTEPFQLVAGAIALSIYSYTAKRLVRTDASMGKMLCQIHLGVVLYGLGSCAVINLFAPLLFQLFLPQYIAAVPILRVLSIALIFRTLNSSLTAVIQAYGKFQWITILVVWNMFFIICMLWFAVSHYQAIGAAAALLIGEIINTAIQVVMIVVLVRSNTKATFTSKVEVV